MLTHHFSDETGHAVEIIRETLSNLVGVEGRGGGEGRRGGEERG